MSTTLCALSQVAVPSRSGRDAQMNLRPDGLQPDFAVPSRSGRDMLPTIIRKFPPKFASPSPQGRVGTAHSTVKGTSEGKVAVPSRSGRDPTPRSWEFLIRLSRRPLKVGSGPTFAVGGSPSLFRSPSPQGRVGTYRVERKNYGT